jgi:hypothetical protein
MLLNEELHPELISRRGEKNAWMLTFVVSVTMAFLQWRLGSIPVAAWVFWGFMIFASLSTSLGNWMDRRTVLRTDGDRISFTNGVRHVDFGWDDIQKVNVIPLRWGKSVQVIGSSAHFEFRTLGEVQYQGEIRGRLGFAEGEAVLEHILKSTGLTLSKEEKGRYYYSRT